MTAVTLLMDLLKRNPLVLVIALALSVAALTYQTIRAGILADILDDAQTELSQVRQERDQLRALVARNNAAVQALKFERESIEADFAALRKEIEGLPDDTSCLDVVNRALGL